MTMKLDAKFTTAVVISGRTYRTAKNAANAAAQCLWYNAYLKHTFPYSKLEHGPGSEIWLKAYRRYLPKFKKVLP